LKSMLSPTHSLLWLVTPLAGVWIEILLYQPCFEGRMVTPLAGVWIEITRLNTDIDYWNGHTPRGCVD